MQGYNANFEKYGAYNFDVDAIHDLYAVLKDFVTIDPKISISLEDNHSIESNDPRGIFDDLYVKNKAIYLIGLEAGNYRVDPPRRASVTLRYRYSWGSLASCPIAVSITGDRETSTAVRSKIEDIIDGRKLWYSWTKLPEHGYVYALIALMIAILMSLVILFHETVGPTVSKDNGSVVFGIELGVLVAIIIFVKNQLFPKMTFDIGRSASRRKRVEMWRNFLFVFVGAGLLVSIAANLLMK